MSINIINPFPSLGVENLIIRAAQAGDSDRIVHYFLENRAYLEPWEPIRPEAFFTVDGWERKMVQLIELQRYGLSYYFLIFEKGNNNVLGVISYNNIIQNPFYSCHLGYSLAKEEQGKGIMRRAIKKTNRWLFEHINMHRIMASYMPRNKRSEAVLKALEFVKEGKAKNYLLINGKWEDHILTSLINAKWRIL